MKTNHQTKIARLLTGIVLAASLVSAPAFCVRDGSFSPAGSFGGGSYSLGPYVTAIVTQNDGKVVVAGTFTYSYYYYNFTNLVRFNADGSVDTSFNPSPNGGIFSMIIQPDQKIIIGGAFSQVSGLTQTAISRLTPSGAPDYPNFQPPAPNTYYIYALGLLSDGKILLGGGFTTLSGYSNSRLACLNPNGSLVTSFNPGIFGTSAFPAVNAIAVYPSGTPSADKIVIGGDFTTVGGLTRINMARVTSTGSLDTNFDMGSSVLNAPVYSVATAYGPFCLGAGNCEKILIGGAFTGLGGSRNYFARLANEGYPDHNVPYSFVDGVVKSIRVQADQGILLGGHFTHAQSYTRNGIVRLIPNQDLIGWDFNWADCSPNGASGGNVETVAVSPIGAIYVGGSFTHFEGAPRPKIARLYTD